MRRAMSLMSLLPLLVCGLASAQVGGLEVRIRSAEEGVPLPGASVTLSSEQGLLAPEAVFTDDEGLAAFPVLRAGSGYVVEVRMPGFASRRESGLRIRAGRIERIEVLLATELHEQVEVRAERGAIDLAAVGHASKFDDEFIQSLPVPGRFYQNVLSLAPGIQDADSDGNPNVHGGRTRDFRAVVSGVSNTDPLTGEWLSRVNSDSIEEIEMLPAGAGVEFGRASAGFSRIIQKQGGNQFEGVVGFLYRSSRLDGTGAMGVSEERSPEFEWMQPSIQLSGALVKNRLWFRLSHERIDREDPFDLIRRMETVTLERSMHSDQITWQASPRNKLSFQYQSDPLMIENYNLSSKVSAESTQTLKRGGDEYRLSWTAPYSGRLLFDSLAAWQDSYHDIIPTVLGAWNGCVYFVDFPALDSGRCLNESTGLITGSHHESWRDQRQRLTVRSQATWYAGRHWGMSHRLKAGFISENERFARQLDRGPDMNFIVLEQFGNANYGALHLRASVPGSSFDRATGNSWALYLEDQLRLARNVTITIGLRLDRSEIDSEGEAPLYPQGEADAFYEQLATGLPASTIIPEVFTAYHDINGFHRDLANVLGASTSDIPIGSTAQQSAFWLHDRRAEDIQLRNTDFSPRFTIAWDPWSDGKTKIALSAGRYYDKIFLAVPLLELEPTWTYLDFWAARWAYWIPYYAAYYVPGSTTSTVSTQMVDRDLRTPYQDELALSVERELWPESSVRLSYVRRRFRDQLQDVDINHAEADRGRCLATERLGDPTVAPSDGEGQLLTDPFTGLEYIDSDPGPGDGVTDDCMGDFERIGGTFGYDREIPDGLPDLYVLNPGWGELLLVGNFNTSEYEAYMVELVRRRYRNWQMNASYTWSKAVGDAEDFNQILGNERSLIEDERGYLSWDQRHVVKLSAVTVTKWGVRLGGTVRWESGLPFSDLVSKRTAFAIPYDYNQGDRAIRFRFRYPTGQRNDQRNPAYWTFSLKVVKEMSLPGGTGLQLSAEAFNLLDDTSIRIEDRINGAGSGIRRIGRRYQLGFRLSF